MSGVTVVTIYCMKDESIFHFKSSPETKIKSNKKNEEDITVKENGHQHYNHLSELTYL